MPAFSSRNELFDSSAPLHAVRRNHPKLPSRRPVDGSSVAFALTEFHHPRRGGPGRQFLWVSFINFLVLRRGMEPRPGASVLSQEHSRVCDCLASFHVFFSDRDIDELDLVAINVSRAQWCAGNASAKRTVLVQEASHFPALKYPTYSPVFHQIRFAAIPVCVH